ncbi:uncharacterized protein K02A2.6-like [Nylanderia fulva]|uniref:uncharacterized protein K02A2.6-like n=1 Tax=Nylanderia fulva TaxID=613905 RepID=UPI0010FBAF09|nr:uncharacterized protein K02A2.6-like [Nylanderia fulva]XP_029178439.1 uncharacterized protein K02A2.6-like [Nylanderia fulva]
MQHYALFLQGFIYDIKYKKSEHHANVDCLSRLPIRAGEQLEIDVIDSFQDNVLQTLPTTAKNLADATDKDNTLRELKTALERGKGVTANRRFQIPMSEFTLHTGVIMRGHRVVVPQTERRQILNELHIGHFEVVKMKGLARRHCWWPGIDQDIERLVASCEECTKTRNNPPKVENHVWEPATYPFERVHLDFAGPFMGKQFLVMVNAYTKWPKNGIISKMTAPYNPSTNGQAERFVQTLKKALRNANANHADLDAALQRILLQYRVMPHSGTNVSPSQLMFNRQIKTRLDFIHPSEQPKIFVNANCGRIVKRHIDQIRKTERARVNSEPNLDESRPPDENATIPNVRETRQPTNDPEPQAEPDLFLPPNGTPRRSARERREPERWGYAVK